MKASPIAAAPQNAPAGVDDVAGRGNALAQPVKPLLVGREQAAAACGFSPDMLDRLNAAGKLPAPVKIGGRVLYRMADLERWVELDCPDRRTFEALFGSPFAAGKATGKGGRGRGR